MKKSKKFKSIPEKFETLKVGGNDEEWCQFESDEFILFALDTILTPFFGRMGQFFKYVIYLERSNSHPKKRRH